MSSHRRHEPRRARGRGRRGAGARGRADRRGRGRPAHGFFRLRGGHPRSARRMRPRRRVRPRLPPPRPRAQCRSRHNPLCAGRGCRRRAGRVGVAIDTPSRRSSTPSPPRPSASKNPIDTDLLREARRSWRRPRTARCRRRRKRRRSTPPLPLMRAAPRYARIARSHGLPTAPSVPGAAPSDPCGDTRAPPWSRQCAPARPRRPRAACRWPRRTSREMMSESRAGAPSSRAAPSSATSSRR